MPEKKEEETLNQLVLNIIQDFEQGCIQLTQRISTQNENRTVLFLDQYENIFNLSGIPQTHITAFGMLLDKLAKSIPSLSIIITIRSEYLHLLGAVGKVVVWCTPHSAPRCSLLSDSVLNRVLTSVHTGHYCSTAPRTKSSAERCEE